MVPRANGRRALSGVSIEILPKFEIAENWINFYDSSASWTIAEKRRLRNRDAQLESNDLVDGGEWQEAFPFKNPVDMDLETYYESLNKNVQAVQ